MKYVALHADKEYPIEVRPLDADRYEITAFDKTFIVTAGGSLLQRDNAVYELAFDERIRVRGREVAVEVLNAREAAARKMSATTGGDAGAWDIKAPMPGKVAAVLVKEGDEVTQGQGLVVIEAMKMENELRAPKAGKISKIHVQQGATVEAKALLLSST